MYAPEKARRVRSDPQRYAVPAVPPEPLAATTGGPAMPILDWQQLLRVATSRIPTEWHIPHCLQGLTREVLRVCVASFSAETGPLWSLAICSPQTSMAIML